MRHKGIKRMSRGKYEVRASATDPRTGKRKEARRIVQGSVDDALAVRQELLDHLLGPAPTERMRFATYARLWLNAKLSSLKPATARKYANDLEGHIIPRLGDFWIDMIRRSDVQAFVSSQLEAGAAGWSVTNRLRLLRTIAKDAVAEGVTAVEFTHRVPAPPGKKYSDEDLNLLTADELASLLKAVPDKWLPVTLLMATTGLRWGEVSGLQWDDIDIGHKLVTINRSNWKGREQLPKTDKSRRTVPLDPQVAELLSVHRCRLLADQNPGLASGWVFPTAEGKLHRGTPLRSVLERALARAGIDKRLTPHGLRRTFNNLARQVSSREVVKAITGHATDEMFEHYSWISLAEKAEATAGVLRLLGMHQSGS